MRNSREITVFVFLSVLLTLGIGCTSSKQDEPVVLDRAGIIEQAQKEGLIMNSAQIAAMADPTVLRNDPLVKQGRESSLSNFSSLRYLYTAALADVTAGDRYGMAKANWQNGVYTLLVKMGGLVEDDAVSYQGWLVRRGASMEVLPVGEAKFIDGDWWIIYESETDWTVFDFFVLTQESREDASLSPTVHLLGGGFQAN